MAAGLPEPPGPGGSSLECPVLDLQVPFIDNNFCVRLDLKMFFPNTKGSLGKDLKKIVVVAEMSIKLLGPCPNGVAQLVECRPTN